MRAALVALLLGAAGCDARLVDACADDRASAVTCVNLVLQGDIGDVSLLAVSAKRGWVGHDEAPSDTPFQLPATLGVALPAMLTDAVQLDVDAYLGRRHVGSGSTLVEGLAPGEHRQLELTLERVAAP